MTSITRSVFLLVAAAGLHSSAAAEPTLREVYERDFLIGVSLNTRMVNGQNAKAGELAGKQFSCLTAENDMKWQLIHPEPDRFNFATADAYFEFAKKHEMEVIGHTLVWHSQVPAWVFQGEDGKPATGGAGFGTGLPEGHEHVPVYSYNLLRLLGRGPVALRRLFGSDDEGAVFFLVSRGLATREGDTLVITALGRSVGAVMTADPL